MSVFFSFFNFYLLDTEISKKVGFLRSFRKDCTQLTYNPTIRLQTQQLFVSFVYHFGGVNSATIYKLSLNFQLLPPLLPQPLQKSTYQKTNRSPNCSQNYCLNNISSIKHGHDARSEEHKSELQSRPH